MGIPGQRVTKGETWIIGSLRLFQLDIVDVVGSVDDFTLAVCNSDQFAVVRVEVHLPVSFLVL